MALRLSRGQVLPLACVLILSSLAAMAAAQEPRAPAVAGQRVFTAGHSFHYFLPPILSDLAALAKIEEHAQAGSQAIGGSRVIQHWDVPDEKNKVKEALRAGKVDVLTLSPIYLPDEGIEKFATLARQHNPAVRVTVQEFWLPFDDQAAWAPGQRPKQIDRDTKTIAELRQAHAAYFASMDEHVRVLNEKFDQPVVYVVPVGQAVLALREKIIAGQAPGIHKQSELFTDVLGHVHPPVMVLAAYCHFAVIYRQSPVGLTTPTALRRHPQADDLNRLLQELAWSAVTSHPLSGVKP